MASNRDSSIPRIAPFLMVSKISFVFLFLDDQGDRCARVIDNVTSYLPRDRDFLSWNGLSAKHFRKAVGLTPARAAGYEPWLTNRARSKGQGPSMPLLQIGLRCRIWSSKSHSTETLLVRRLHMLLVLLYWSPHGPDRSVKRLPHSPAKAWQHNPCPGIGRPVWRPSAVVKLKHDEQIYLCKGGNRYSLAVPIKSSPGSAPRCMYLPCDCPDILNGS